MKSSRHRLSKFKFVGGFILVSFLCVLCGSSSAQDWKTTHNGIEYARVDHKIGNDPVKINLLRLDLTKVRLDIHHAFDRALGVEPTSEIAKRYAAIAAINGGFFRKDETPFSGDAAGILMIDGNLVSESVNNRATLIIGNGGRGTFTLFGHYGTTVWVRPDENHIASSIELSGINRERKKSEAIIYDASLKQRAKRGPGDIELLLGKCSRPKFSRSSDMRTICKSVAIVMDGGDLNPVSEYEYVISVDKDFAEKNHVAENYSALPSRHGKGVTVVTRINDGSNFFFADNTSDITNGVAQLIKNGKIGITWEQEKASRSFAEMRHPRTAVAKLQDGKFLMITVDGRQPGVSVGMTLLELAEYILSLGATDAMNLDGGGSTTMFLDGKVVNTVSDKEGERKVSDAILVTLRKKVQSSRN